MNVDKKGEILAIESKDLEIEKPGTCMEDAHKKFYKEEDIWVFVREESFGEYEGVLVLVNEKGGIRYMDECQIDVSHITRLRMKDESFVVS